MRRIPKGTHGGFWQFQCEAHPPTSTRDEMPAISCYSAPYTCKIVKRVSPKGRALNRARAILKAATPMGFTLVASSINPGGIAVDGEASAWYRAPYAHGVYVYASLSGNGRGYVRREDPPESISGVRAGHRCMGRNLGFEDIPGFWSNANVRNQAERIKRLIGEASRQTEGCHGSASPLGTWGTR